MGRTAGGWLGGCSSRGVAPPEASPPISPVYRRGFCATIERCQIKPPLASPRLAAVGTGPSPPLPLPSQQGHAPSTFRVPEQRQQTAHCLDPCNSLSMPFPTSTHMSLYPPDPPLLCLPLAHHPKVTRNYSRLPHPLIRLTSCAL